MKKPGRFANDPFYNQTIRPKTYSTKNSQMPIEDKKKILASVEEKVSRGWTRICAIQSEGISDVMYYRWRREYGAN